MALKKTLRYIFFATSGLLAVYLIVIFFFGGFGPKTPVFTSAGKSDKALLFGHRGVAVYYPENSREGIKGAVKLGFRAVEADIRRAKDKQFVVFHDEDGERVLHLNKRIDETLVSDLKKKEIFLRSGFKSHAQVPTVEEFIASDKDSLVFYFDMKSSSFEDADKMVELIKKHGREKSVILTNWNLLFIFYVEANYPEIMTALEGFDAGKEWLYELIPKNLRPDFLSGFFVKTNEEHINWLQKNNLMSSKIIYGVDSLNYHDALNAGFKNIIIDYDSIMCDDPSIKDLLNS